MDPPLIEVRDLAKAFDGRTVLDGVSFTLHKGEVMAVIGKSGVGKSVLLKHLVGLLAPDDGEVRYQGQPVHRMDARQRSAFLGRISFMFQNNALFSQLTVYDNVALPLRHRRGRSRRGLDRAVRERLEQMELGEAAGQYPEELSGGMQKRVALARALVTRPDIVLFDEPTTGQDPVRKNAILAMIAAYQRQDRFSAILISHDLPDIFFVSDTILALYQGRIIFEGPPADFEDFDHPFRREFVQSLEALQRELTGLYSRRQFKLRYQAELFRDTPDPTYTVARFSLEPLEPVATAFGHTAAQELIAATGSLIQHHFSDRGGFTTRYRRGQFVTLLPYTEIGEARQLLAAFGRDVTRRLAESLAHVLQAPPDGADRVSLTLAAGVAGGRARTDLDTVIETAGRNQAPIAQMRLPCREPPP